MSGIKLVKLKIREHCKTVRRNISPDERQRASEAICRKISTLASYRYAQAVLLYAPINSEVNIEPIFRNAINSGKSVYFPKCGEASHMDFIRVSSKSELSRGAYGIPEPPKDGELFDESKFGSNTVCIIPALSFDKSGHRLGYGGGYYDRFLSEYSGAKIGVVFEQLLSDELPYGRFDVPADIVITENSVTLTLCKQ